MRSGKLGVRAGRAVHGASDVSDSQACNQCLCGVWVRSQLAALHMLHRMKGIFGAGHEPVVFSEYSGFLHHQKGPIPPLSWVGATLAAVLSPGREARISQGNLCRKCYKIQNTNTNYSISQVVVSVAEKGGKCVCLGGWKKIGWPGRLLKSCKEYLSTFRGKPCLQLRETTRNMFASLKPCNRTNYANVSPLTVKSY
jgi:hypothetical protein